MMCGLSGMSVLALTGAQRAVRDIFQQGGSVGAVLLALVGLVCMVLLARGLAEWLHRRAIRSVQPDEPKMLFHKLLSELELTRRERKYLRTLAKAQALAHPTAMLLSNVVFDRCVEQGPLEFARAADCGESPAARIRGVLFPDYRNMTAP